MNTVAVTRPAGLGKETTQLVKGLGWGPMIVHTVELKPREESEIYDQMSRVLTKGPVDWLVFMSPNGVGLLLNILKSHGSLLPSALGDLRILAVGPKTREALRKQGVAAVHVPDKFSSSGIANFLDAQGLDGRRVILTRSSAADDSLAKELEKSHATVDTVSLYDSTIPSDETSLHQFLDGTAKNEVQAMLFTSSLSASNLFLMSKNHIGPDELLRRFRKIRIGAIGPVTAQRLVLLGIPPKVMPDTFIIDDALKELLGRPFS